MRPSWIWQRKRCSSDELVVAFANDGAASVPGVLRVARRDRATARRLRAAASTRAIPSPAACASPRSVCRRGSPASEVRLRAELELKGVRRPVRWACAQPLDEDGALVVRLLKHDDPGLAEGDMNGAAPDDDRVLAGWTGLWRF